MVIFMFLMFIPKDCKHIGNFIEIFFFYTLDDVSIFALDLGCAWPSKNASIHLQKTLGLFILCYLLLFFVTFMDDTESNIQVLRHGGIFLLH